MTKEEIRQKLDKNKEIILTGDHRYIHPTSGKELMGATSVAGLLPKEWLAAWGAKEAVKKLGFYDLDNDENKKKLEEVKQSIAEMSVEDYYQLLVEAKKAFSVKSTEAKDLGTEGHELIERYIKWKMGEGEKPEVPENLKFVNELFNWLEENVAEYIASEAIVCDLDRDIGGKIDFLCKLKDDTDGLTIIDFKFANQIDASYYLQLAGYIHMLKWMGIDVPNWRRLIIRLPKTETIIGYKDFKYQVMDNLFEVIEPKTDLDYDIETFVYLREVGRWINYVKKINGVEIK
jgi:predicted RecB family nuclease